MWRWGMIHRLCDWWMVFSTAWATATMNSTNTIAYLHVSLVSSISFSSSLLCRTAPMLSALSAPSCGNDRASKYKVPPACVLLTIQWQLWRNMCLIKHPLVFCTAGTWLHSVTDNCNGSSMRSNLLFRRTPSLLLSRATTLNVLKG